ncbi:MAG: hypothetical protein ACXVSL_08745 [Solirubrobacteraceae bacterium]
MLATLGIAGVVDYFVAVGETELFRRLIAAAPRPVDCARTRRREGSSPATGRQAAGLNRAGT